MVTIRLARYGKRKHPTFRVVVSEQRKDTVGPYLEQLGTYDPHAPAESATQLKVERVQHWLSVGATASPSVHNLLVAAKLLDAKTIPLGAARKAASAEGGEEPKAEAKPAPEAPKEEPKADEPKPEAAPAA